MHQPSMLGKQGRWIWVYIQCLIMLCLLHTKGMHGAERMIKFHDNFDAYPSDADGTPRWLPVYGRWHIRDGRYVQDEYQPTETLTFVREPTFGDLDFSVQFRVLPVGAGVRAAGMVFRAQDSRRFYFAHFDTRFKQLIVYAVRYPARNMWRELGRVRGLKLRTGVWHTGRVRCKGNRITIWLDGKRIIELTDDTYKVGKVGLRTGQGAVEFDNVIITGTLARLSRRWRVVSEAIPVADHEARWLKDVERIIAVRGGGYFPVLIKLKSGALAAIVRGGAPHVGVGGRLDIIKSSDGGKTWTLPKRVVYMPPDSRNPAFGQAPDGTLVLAFARTGPYPDGKWDHALSRRYTVWLMLSHDEGETWTQPQQLNIAPLQYGSPFGKIVTLPDGTMLMNIYGWYQAREGEALPPEKRGYFSYAFRSTDNGRTWGEPELIARGYNECALLALRNGAVIAMLRRHGGGLAQSISHDGGRTWSEPKLIVDNQRHPADVIELRSGKLLLTFGHRILPYGVQAVLSHDGGKSWDFEHRVMLEWDSVNTDCGYPSSVQLDDGTIVTMYYGVRHHSYPELHEYAMCVRYREEQLSLD